MMTIMMEIITNEDNCNYDKKDDIKGDHNNSSDDDNDANIFHDSA